MKKLISNSPIPLFYQLREIIRDKIVAEEWEYGEEIPSELKLCEEFNLCRGTVRKALDGLVDEGYIIRERGRGSFVVYKKSASSFMLEPSLLRDKGKASMDDYARLLYSDFVEPSSRIIKTLQGERVLQIDRVHYIDKKPIAIDKHYIKQEWAQEIINQDLEKVAIYRWLENEFKVEFDKYKTNIQAVMLNKYENELLGFPSTPIGMMIECTSFVNNEAVVFNSRIYRGDSCNLNLEFVLSNQKLQIVEPDVDFGVINFKHD